MMKFMSSMLAVMLLASYGATAAPLLYVPTGEANDLVIIDVRSDSIVGRIDELENAHGLAASAKSDYLVAGSMQQIDASGSRAAGRPAAVSEAEHAAHHAAGTESAAPAPASPSYLAIIHPKHGHVMRRVEVRALTHHTAVAPDGKTAIAVHSGAGGISVVDLDTMAVVKTVQTGEWPNYAVFSGDGRRLYVSNARSGTVSELDTRDWSVLRDVAAGKEPEHLALAPKDDSRLYVVDVAAGAVAAVDLRKAEVVKRYQIGAETHGAALSADGRWLFASSKGEGRLVRIDLSNDEQLAIDLRPAPYHVEYAAAVNKLYVSSRKNPLIWVIDPASLRILKEIDIGAGVAHQMVILDRE